MTIRLPRSAPESQGISSNAVSRFLQAIAENDIELHSLMLVRHGQVVAEGWWAPYAAPLKHKMFSLSKSFTSSAVGFAVTEGLLSPDDKVLSFFPEDVPNDPSPHLEAMRVRHLLTMATGHTADTIDPMKMTPDGNWAAEFLRLPVDKAPGTHFLYNTGATYMLSAILRKATGQNLLDYLRPRLLEPLGIEGATWETCPRGIAIGGYGLSITTEDIAKFGQLYLNKGLWGERRILPENWIEEATSKQIANGDEGESDWAQGYGYQFWRCRHGVYRGDGAFGQFCIVMPQQDAVLAITSGTNDMQGVLNRVWEHLLPAMRPGAAAEDPQAYAELNAQLKGLKLEPPERTPSSPRERSLPAETYRLEENERTWKALAIRFEKDEAVLTFQEESEIHELRCGRESWAEGTSKLLEGTDSRLAAAFTWENPDRLLLTLRFIETPFCITAAVDFEDDEVRFSYRINVGFGGQEAPPIRGRLR
ncbi:serine hydrolase domain-containing protein [Cohnella zeiphila]|uniref:Serine hydrolase n=1 Tax=Cohnella zeiphila TaxID=2761120 RepID=A0A7X0SM89_9BACL|nr:serine hydrolase [Cohnella zeiphila]MBB6732484.1 serine hydrolase [Cohnella zeiphila]